MASSQSYIVHRSVHIEAAFSVLTPASLFHLRMCVHDLSSTTEAALTPVILSQPFRNGLLTRGVNSLNGGNVPAITRKQGHQALERIIQMHNMQYVTSRSTRAMPAWHNTSTDFHKEAIFLRESYLSGVSIFCINRSKILKVIIFVQANSNYLLEI